MTFNLTLIGMVIRKRYFKKIDFSFCIGADGRLAWPVTILHFYFLNEKSIHDDLCVPIFKWFTRKWKPGLYK